MAGDLGVRVAAKRAQLAHTNEAAHVPRCPAGVEREAQIAVGEVFGQVAQHGRGREELAEAIGRRRPDPSQQLAEEPLGLAPRGSIGAHQVRYLGSEAGAL